MRLPKTSQEPLFGLLRRVNQRRIVNVALSSVVASLLVGTTTAICVTIVERGLGVSLNGLLACLTLAFATLLTVAFFGFRSLGNQTSKAFWVDKNAGFQERYITAFEIAGSSHPTISIVGRKLLQNTRLESLTTKPTAIALTFTTRFRAALLALLLLVLVAAFLYSSPTVTPKPSASEAAADQGSALAAVAEMLAKDAELKDSVHLTAIARALTDQLEQLGSSEAGNNQLATINDLLDQAADFYRTDAPSWLGKSEGMRLSELSEALQSMAASEVPGAQPELELAIDPYARRPEEQIAFTPNALFSVPDENSELSDPTASQTDINGETNSGLDGNTLGQRPQLMSLEEFKGVGATPMGAALDSGRGVSHAAGLGEEDYQLDENFGRIGISPNDEMILSTGPQDHGNRIRIEMVPETAAEISHQGGGVGAVQAASASEHPADHEFVPFYARAISAAYFSRSP